MIKRAIDRLTANLYDSGKNTIFSSIRRAFIFLIPVFMVGAFSLSLEYFPIPVVREFITTALDGKICQMIDLIYNATYGLAAVYLVMVLSYFEAQRAKVHSDVRLFAVISSVACYFGFMGPEVYSGKADVLLYTRMANIFSALLIALACTRLFFLFYKLFYGKKANECLTLFERGIYSLAPLSCCLAVTVLIAGLISLIPGVGNFNDLVIATLNKPFEYIGGTFFGGLLVMLSISVLWLFGIHGSNVFDSLLTSSTGPFAFGNSQIVTKPFIDTFVLMGGCGTSLCLLLALLIFGKSRKDRRLCKLSAVPVLFNINETLIFGMPIVFNPIYAIPFVLTPLVSYTIAYIATFTGLVPQILNDSVQWTTPIGISAYQATGSVAGGILQIVILAVGVGIYAPFVRLANRIERENTSRNIDRLTEICRSCEAHKKPYALDGVNSALHSLEVDIASKLSDDIRNGKILLYYQPQVKDGKVISAEALLRFSQNEHGREFLYPPLVIGIANNYNLRQPLSCEIVKVALSELYDIQKNEDPTFKIAVNLDMGLLIDDSFRKWLIRSLEESGVAPHTFGVEITENADISDIENYAVAFNEIKQAGAEILMDDFSMGNTSITILRKNIFDYIKVDGNLIKELSNDRSRSIVESVVQLGKQLNFDVIAEYVESEWQRDILLDMGCEIFQGYLYYRPMPFEKLRSVIDSKRES